LSDCGWFLTKRNLRTRAINKYNINNTIFNNNNNNNNNNMDRDKVFNLNVNNTCRYHVSISAKALDINTCVLLASDEGAGAISTFCGVTRNTFNERKVSKLEYECYEPMAIKKLKELCETAFEKWRTTKKMNSIKNEIDDDDIVNEPNRRNRASIEEEAETTGKRDEKPNSNDGGDEQDSSLLKIVIQHRIGTVLVGEPSVIIAISSAHREASLDAVKWAIDELKRTVPIWKKEYFENGEVWKENSEQRLVPNNRNRGYQECEN